MYSPLTEEKTAQQTLLTANEPVQLPHAEHQPPSPSALPPAGNRADSAPDAVSEFTHLLLFSLAAEVSGLPQEFYRGLTQIVGTNDTPVEQLKALNALLARIRPQTSAALRPFIDSYLVLVHQARQLQQQSQTNGVANNLPTFLNALSALLDSPVVRAHLPDALVTQTMLMLKQAQAATRLLQELTAGRVPDGQLISHLRHSALLPESVQTLLDAVETLITLHQRHPLPAENNHSRFTWLVAVLQDAQAAALLSDILPAELAPILLKGLAAAQQITAHWQNNASWSEWVSWLAENAVGLLDEHDRALLREWLLVPESRLHQLLNTADALSLLARTHSLPTTETLTGWLLAILSDVNTHRVLKSFLPASAAAMLEASAPLLRLVNRYPASMPVSHQLSWITDEYRSPSPELRVLLAQLPLDTFISQLRQRISNSVINPDILDFLLILADPQTSLKEKSVLLSRQLTGFIDLPQAVRYAVRNYVPHGELMLGLWDWYQALPADLSWKETLSRLTASLQQHWPQEAALMQSLVSGSWQEVGEKAFRLALECSPEVKWIALRYMELSILWAGQRLLTASDAPTREIALRDLSATVQHYFSARSLTVPQALPDILRELEVLLTLRDDISRLPRDNGWLSWTGGLMEILERHPQASRLRNRVVQGVTDTINGLLGENMAETSREIMQLLGSKVTRPHAAGPSSTTTPPHTEHASHTATVPDAEQREHTSPGAWFKPQPRQNPHHSRASLRRRNQKKRQHRGPIYQPTVSIPLSRPATERLTAFIHPGTLRNAALGVAGLYLFSQFGTAAAAPAETLSTEDQSPSIMSAENENVFRLIKAADGPETFSAEIDGERYALSPSAFDTAIDWQKIWARLSTLSLTLAVLSVPGLLTYRYFLRKKSPTRPASQEQDEGTELQVIEVQALPAETEEPGAESEPVAGRAKAHNALPETPLLPALSPVRSGEVTAADWRRNTLPEIAALVVLLTGSGGYVYSRRQANYYDQRAGQLLNEAPDFNPFMVVTPALLKHYHTEGSADSLEGEVTSQEIAFLLAGERNSISATQAPQTKREVDEPSSLQQKATSRTKRAVNAGKTFADSKTSPSLQALVRSKWREKEESYLPTRRQLATMVPSRGLWRSGETWFIKINGEFWLFEPTDDHFDRGVIKNLSKNEQITIFTGRNQIWTANRYEATLREGETLVSGPAADSQVSPTLKKLIASQWKKDGYPLNTDQKNNLIVFKNLYRAGEHYFVKINNEFWFFEPGDNSLEEGHLKNFTQRTQIKIFPDKDGAWTTTRYAEALTEGEALIDRLISWQEYSEKFKTLLRREIEYLLKDKALIKTSTFIKMLAEVLILVFIRKAQDIPLGLEILKAIIEISSKNKETTPTNRNLLQLTTKENAIPDIYYTLLNDEIVNALFYNNALTEFKGGKGIFAEAQATLINGKQLLDNTLRVIDKKLASLTEEIQQEEAAIKSKNYFNVQGNPELAVELEKKRKKLKIKKETQLADKLKRDEIARNFTFRSEKLTQLLQKVNEEQTKNAPTLSAYKAGVELAEHYIKEEYLDVNNYNKIMFRIINAEYLELKEDHTAQTPREKYAAAKYHLNKRHSLTLLLDKLVDTLPENLSGIIVNPWLIIERKNDYRDILISEEAAALYYYKNEQTIYALFQETATEFDELDVNMVIAALFFYKLRNNTTNSKLKRIRLDEIIQFYFTEKSKNNPLSVSTNIPDGFYTINNFKKRSAFPSQYDYNEQFNVYMDKYMAYDIHMRTMYSQGEAKVPYYLLLSPFSAIHYFLFHVESGDLTPTDRAAKLRGGGVSLQLANDDWLLAFSIDGRIKTLYVPKTEINNDFYHIFINPESNFGIRREVNTRGNVVPLGDRYPPETMSETKLKDYTFEWVSLGYNFSGYPVFINVPSSPFDAKENQTTLAYLHEFFSYHQQNYINASKQALDEVGFWHHLATAVIPFYGVIYGAITDRYYQLSAGDIVSIVFDILSVLACLINIGITIAQITDSLAISLTVKYNELLLSGLNRNAALLQIVAEYPSLMTKTAVIPFLATLRKEIINLFNPTPFDINDFASRLYGFTSSGISTVAGKVKNSVLNLPTKINTNWRMKDPKVIEKIKTEATLRNAVYELENPLENAGSTFIKQGDDFYPVVPGAGENSWYLTNSADSQSIKIEQPVFNRNGVWTTSPVSEAQDLNPIFNDNVSSVKNSAPVTTTTQSALKQKNVFKRVTRYQPEVGDYVTDSDFAVVPVGDSRDFADSQTLPQAVAQKALTDMQQKGKALTDASLTESITDKTTLNEIEKTTALSSEYNTMLTENNTKDVLLYALVKKTANWQNDPGSVYGMAKLHYHLASRRLQLDSLLSHPYIFAANSQACSALISQTEAAEYKLRHSFSHLAGASVKHAVDYIHSFTDRYRLKTLSTDSASPATVSLISSLNNINSQATNPAKTITTQANTLMEDIRQILGRGNGAGENRYWLTSAADNNTAKMLADRLFSPSQNTGPAPLIKKDMKSVAELAELTHVEIAHTGTETTNVHSPALLRLRGGGPLFSRPAQRPDLPAGVPVDNMNGEPDIIIGNDVYNYIEFNPDRFNNVKTTADTIDQLDQTSSDNRLKIEHYYLGKQYYKNPKYHYLDELSPNEKMQLFLSESSNYEVKGALIKKLEAENKRYQDYASARKAKNWNETAVKHGATAVTVSPQELYLRHTEDQSLALTILMSWALENNKHTAFSDQLMKLRDRITLNESILYKNINALNQEAMATRFTSFIRDGIENVTLSNISESESKIFYFDTCSVRINVQTHQGTLSLSITKAKNDGFTTYYLYHPNYGIAAYSNYKDLCAFLKTTLSDYTQTANNIQFIPLDLSQAQNIEINGSNIQKIVSDEANKAAQPVPGSSPVHPATPGAAGRVKHSDLPENTPLSKISMLGSHDAGTYDYSGLSAGALLPFAYRTQSLTLKEQAQFGARYFDLRIASRKDGSFGFFHGNSITSGNAITDVRQLLTYVKANPDDFYVLKFSFLNDKGVNDLPLTHNSDAFFSQILNEVKGNLITEKETSNLASAQVKLLKKGKNLAIMVDYDKYSGIKKFWSYRDQVHTSWSNQADAQKTAEHIKTFCQQPVPENKLTLIQTTMPFASVKNKNLTSGVEAYLSRNAHIIASAVDEIKIPGIINGDFIGSSRSATVRFREKIQSDNKKLTGATHSEHVPVEALRREPEISGAEGAVMTDVNNKPYMVSMSDQDIEEAKKAVMDDLWSTPGARQQMDSITRTPAGHCDKAAAKILELLQGKGYYTRVIGVLSYQNALDNAPGDHYVVVAGKNGKYLVIDSTFVQYLSVPQREWVVTSWEKWKEALITSDHLKNKFIIAKEYPTLSSATMDIGNSGIDITPWLQSRYAADEQFQIMQMPELYKNGLKEMYRRDIEFLNSKNGISTLLNIKNKLTALDQKLITLINKDTSYGQKDKSTPTKILDEIQKTKRKKEKYLDLRYLPYRVNNYLKLSITNPKLKMNDIKLNSTAYNKLIASDILVSKIPYLTYIARE